MKFFMKSIFLGLLVTAPVCGFAAGYIDDIKTAATFCQRQDVLDIIKKIKIISSRGDAYENYGCGRTVFENLKTNRTYSVYSCGETQPDVLFELYISEKITDDSNRIPLSFTYTFDWDRENPGTGRVSRCNNK